MQKFRLLQHDCVELASLTQLFLINVFFVHYFLLILQLHSGEVEFAVKIALGHTTLPIIIHKQPKQQVR